MKNVFITGSGRSGTSMLAGSFRLTGAFMGTRLHTPREANPKGFFEDAETNELNESIIRNWIVAYLGEEFRGRIVDELAPGQLWLTAFPAGDWLAADEGERERIRAQTVHAPFCLKDPRFSLTIRSWLPYAGDCVILVIFRDPSITVESILLECRRAGYLRSVALSVDDAFALWRQCYARLLQLRLEQDNVRFISFDQVVDGSALPMLGELVGCPLDRSFPTGELNRSRPVQAPDDLSTRLHRLLLDISGTDLGAGLGEETRRAAEVLVKEIAAADAPCPADIFPMLGIARAARTIDRLKLERDKAVCEAVIAEIEQERTRLRAELAFKAANLRELDRQATLGAGLEQRLQAAHALIQEGAERERQLAERCAWQQSVLDGAWDEHGKLRWKLESVRASRHRMKRSLSWQVTVPLRIVQRLLRRASGGEAA
jgi:hypothetical protein